MMEAEEIVRRFTQILGTCVEGAAALIIAQAIIKASFSYAKGFIRTPVDKLELRLALGKTLALTLEFLLAADILRTAVAPTWDDIGKLSAIAALRTVLNYFLERELKHAENKS